MRLLATVSAVLIGATLAAQQAPDAGRVLADMRQALGGDAAIAAVQAFSATGSESRNVNGHTGTADVEWVCQLPDRFVRVRRLMSPAGETIETDGFNGDAHIRRRDSDLSYPPDAFQHDTPDQKAEREKRAVLSLKHDFSRVAIAMIGVPSIDPLDASIDTPQAVEGKHMDVVALRSTDGYEARLFVDSASHLPFAIAWLAAPIVTLTSTTTEMVRVPRGQSPNAVLPPPPPPPTIPGGDPAAGLPKVLHQLRFEDYRPENGLNWPHRFVERVGTQVWTTTKVSKYRINPKIDSKTFAAK